MNWNHQMESQRLEKVRNIYLCAIKWKYIFSFTFKSAYNSVTQKKVYLFTICLRDTGPFPWEISTRPTCCFFSFLIWQVLPRVLLNSHAIVLACFINRFRVFDELQVLQIKSCAAGSILIYLITSLFKLYSLTYAMFDLFYVLGPKCKFYFVVVSYLRDVFFG